MQSEILISMRSFIIQFDLFGQPPAFRILGKQKYNTIFGAVFTLGTIFFVLTYLIVGIQEIIARDAPAIIQSDRQVIETSPFSLNRDNFTLAITMANLNSQPLTTLNKYFTIELKNCQTTRIVDEKTQTSNVTRNCTIIPLEACTKEHFLSPSQIDYFQKIRLGSVQCIKSEYWDKNPPILQGIKTSSNYSSLTITVSTCKNTTKYSGCAPQEEIIEQMKTGYYAVHISDSLLQLNRPGNISLDIINLQFNTFSITTSKQIVQQFKVIDTKTDSGLIFNDISSQQILIQDVLRESTDLYNDQYLIMHNIYLSSKYIEYNRSYVKIQAILSRVGGLYQMLFLLLAALIKPLVQLMLDIDMANEIFRFEKQQKIRNNNQSFDHQVVDAFAGQIKSRRRLLSPLSKGKQHIFETNQDQTNNKNISQNLNLSGMMANKDKFDTNIFQILMILFGCQRKKKTMLLKAKEKYMQKLDIKSIIQKLYEVEQLKDVILTEEQKTLFQYIPKPSIVENLEVARYIDVEDQKIHSLELHQAFEAYEKVLSQQRQSEINKKIIQQLDPDIHQIFQNAQKGIEQEQIKYLNDIPLNQSNMKYDQDEPDEPDDQSKENQENIEKSNKIQEVYFKGHKRMKK